MDEITTLNRVTYDRIAGLYADNLDQLIVSGGRYFAALEDAFLSRLPRRGVVGDLGCGPGRDGARIAAAGHAVLGVDLSGSMLRLASTGLAGRVVQGDLRAVPLASASLDGIWNVASLLHVPEQGTGSVLREFRRLLRTEGVLALVTALGGEPRLETVPYAPAEQRWFVYRDGALLLEQVASAGLVVEHHEVVDGNRRWLTVLARAGVPAQVETA